ncbi:MAG: universal stress protein [Planctomycetes bacterium]|nr:universal stress protein [Planctomycetota bacterium]
MSLRLQSLLVGIDLDPFDARPTQGSLCALRAATRLATRTGAELTLAHVLRAGAERGAAGRTLERLASPLRAEGLRCTSLVLVGQAAETLLAAAERLGADAVVVGRSSARPRKAMGGQALHLLESGAHPRVWVVHGERERHARRVLAAVELDDKLQAMVDEAASLAEELGSALHLLHAWQQPFGDGWQEQDAGVGMERRQAAAVAAVQAAARAAGRTDAHLHVGCDHPARSIRRAVERLQPEVLVMGTHSRRGIPGLVLGNTAERVLPRVQTSLWVMPIGAVSERQLGRLV